DDMVEPFDMGPRRQLRHHPAKGSMLVELGAHYVGTYRAAARLIPHDHRRGGFVAAGLDAQNDGLRLPGHDELVYSKLSLSPTLGLAEHAIAPPLRPDRNTRQPAGAGPGQTGARIALQGPWHCPRPHRNRGL